MNFGVTELLIVLGLVLLFFGAPRLPRLARSFGQAAKEFKKGVSDDGDDGDEEAGPRKIEAKGEAGAEKRAPT